ncbi:MAG: serine protease [Acidimicrobiaceae bacterium]|nr:serine protease [Acidimicrobiaceae bacterium]
MYPRKEFEVEWEENSDTNEPVAPGVTPKVHYKARLSFLNALTALALLVAIGGLGFFLGHDVVKPATPPSAASRTSGPYFGSNGSGTFPGGFGGGVSFPSISGPSRNSSTNDPAAAKIAKSVDPGLVDINTNLSYQGASAAGTGMVLTSNGLVLTNNHVIAGATSISATDIATGTTYQAKVVGYDETRDVALIKLDNASGLNTIKTANSSDVVKDEKIVGIGNAGGVGGTPNYAAGSVVATNQSITASDNENPAGAEQLTGMIEMNADIQPGDSGGPLVNSKGKVIGMDTAGSSESGGFGFVSSTPSTTQAYAIPINTALAVVTTIEKGTSTSTVHVGATAFLGVEVGTPTGVGATTPSTVSGVPVDKTIPNTPAGNSALTGGDVITTINGQSVTTTTDIAKVLQEFRPGDSVTVGYVNVNGTAQTLSLTLISGPAQ